MVDLANNAPTGQNLRFPKERPVGIGAYEGIVEIEIFEFKTPSIVDRDAFAANIDNALSEAGGDQEATGNALGSMFHNMGIAGNFEEVSTGNTMTLYLPPGISFADAMEFDEAEMGATGAALLAMAGSNKNGEIVSFADAGYNVARAAVDSILSAFVNGGSADAARLAATRLARWAPAGQKVEDAASTIFQTTTNPNKRMLFKSVLLRSFNFNFRFIPKSSQEAEEVKRIIKMFRTNMYPETFDIGVGGSDIPFGYKFPKIFKIKLKHKGSEVGFKIKPCYLVNVSTNFNNGSMAFFEDNNFTETDLSLSFREYKALNKQDIEDGY
jgi:hypothetical protein